MSIARRRLRLALRLRHARRLVASGRSEIADRRLARTLAFIAGAINAGGFLLVGQFTSHMTGLVSSVADNLVSGSGWVVFFGLVAVIAFTGGAGVSSILINWKRRSGHQAPYAAPLLLEAILLLAFAMIGSAVHLQPVAATMAMPLLCFLMGLQNATITKVSGARMRTTHMTGIVTDVGIELGKLAYWNRDNSCTGRRILADRAKIALLLSLLGCFFGGGIVGAIGFVWIGPASVIPIAILLAGLAIAPSVEASLIGHLVGRRAARPSSDG